MDPSEILGCFSKVIAGLDLVLPEDEKCVCEKPPKLHPNLEPAFTPISFLPMSVAETLDKGGLEMAQMGEVFAFGNCFSFAFLYVGSRDDANRKTGHWV